MTLEEKVDAGLEKLANEMVEECGWIAEAPADFVWGDVCGDSSDPDEHAPDTPVKQGQVYGSSLGPDLEQIVCDDIGLGEEEAAEVHVNAWGLCYELESLVNDKLEAGAVFIDDNCFFFQLVEE